MHIERSGSGPRTFFGLHGWSGDHRTFLPVTVALPENVSFYSADLPGCGQSHAPREWTLDVIAEEVAEAIWSLPAPVTVVGNCSGALIALLAAQRVGGRIDRMVMIDMFAFFPWYFRVFLGKLIGRYAYATAFQNPLGRSITNFSLRDKRTETTTLTGGFALVDHDVTYRYLQLFEHYPQPESFGSLTQQMELVYGEKTFQAIRDSVADWQRVWPKATAIRLKGAGHLPILEATEQLRGILYHQSEELFTHSETDGGLCRAVLSSIAN